jgi:hypothetical protein
MNPHPQPLSQTGEGIFLFPVFPTDALSLTSPRGRGNKNLTPLPKERTTLFELFLELVELTLKILYFLAQLLHFLLERCLPITRWSRTHHGSS